MTSRDPADLEPQLRFLWEWARDEWKRLYPNRPQPFLTCTYRGPVAQLQAFNSGASKVGFGDSLHNFQPAYAFDMHFEHEGVADWSHGLYRDFALLLKPHGLVWGGDWPGLVDAAHFQLPMTPADARAGRVPVLSIPRPPEPGWALVISNPMGGEPIVMPMQAGEHVVMRLAPERKRYYLDIRAGGAD